MNRKFPGWMVLIAVAMLFAPVAGASIDGTQPTPSPIPPPHNVAFLTDGTQPTPSPIPPPHVAAYLVDGTQPTPSPIPPPHRIA